MIAVHLGELRASWLAWLSTSLAFVATNYGLALSMGIVHNGLVASTRDPADEITPMALVSTGIFNLALCVIIALGVLAAATQLVVNSRRGGIARLLLAGATPGQVVQTLMIQLAAVTVASAVVADLLLLATLDPFMRKMVADRGAAPMPTAYAAWPLLVANGLCVVLALLGGLRQAWVASRIPPVEALREAAGGSSTKVGPTRWAKAVVGLLIVLGVVVGVGSMVPTLGKDAGDMLMMSTIFLVPLMAWTISQVSPLFMGRLVRLWTAALPLPSAPWQIARGTVAARGDRIAQTVNPMVFAIGLLFGMYGVINTFSEALRRRDGEGLSGTSMWTFLEIMGPALVISVCGGIGVLILMSRQRSAELALTGIIGATPRQQLLLPALEAFVITTTAAILGFVCSAIALAFLGRNLQYFFPGAPVVIPWGALGGIYLVCLAIALAATVLPVLSSLRRPANQVVAHLVAS